MSNTTTPAGGGEYAWADLARASLRRADEILGGLHPERVTPDDFEALREAKRYAEQARDMIESALMFGGGNTPGT